MRVVVTSAHHARSCNPSRGTLARRRPRRSMALILVGSPTLELLLANLNSYHAHGAHVRSYGIMLCQAYDYYRRYWTRDPLDLKGAVRLQVTSLEARVDASHIDYRS